MNLNLNKNLNKADIKAIMNIKNVCIKTNTNAYLVGGAIRDIILNKPVKDIDICIEDNPMIIINNLESIDEYKYFEEFQTSTIKFNSGVQVDLIRCRKEFYQDYGMLPQIVPSNIKDDLFRRDFTINAIAYDIINNCVLDPFNGIDDLNRSVIKKIHSNSYYEDPTRIFRAIRYSSRYNMNIFDKDEIIKCVEDNCLDTISNDRIIKELELICSEENWLNSIRLCVELHIFNTNKDIIGKKLNFINNNHTYIKVLKLFLAIKQNDFKERFIQNTFLNKDMRKSMKNYLYNKDIIIKDLKQSIDNYDIYNCLKGKEIYELILLSFHKEVLYKIINYYKNLKDTKLQVKGNDILNFNIGEGIIIGKVMKILLKFKLNAGIDDDKKYLQQNIGEILNVFKNKNN